MKEKEGKTDEDRETKGTLIVEFSIENVQVVQRRSAKEDAARTRVCHLPFPTLFYTHADKSFRVKTRRLISRGRGSHYPNVKRTIRVVRRERRGARVRRV